MDERLDDFIDILNSRDITGTIDKLQTMDAKKVLARQARQLKKRLDDLDIKSGIASRTDDSITIRLTIPLQEHRLLSYVVISNGLVPGQSFNIVMTAIVRRPFHLGQNITSLAAFLQQLSLVLNPCHFLLDFDSSRILIRQSMLCAGDVSPAPSVFINFVRLVVARLEPLLARIEADALSEKDARLMADFLSEYCFEAIAE